MAFLNQLHKLSLAPFRRLVWILPILFAIHELEEWYIADWHSIYWIEFPGYSNIEMRVWLIFISICAFIWTGISLIPRNEKTTAWIIFPFFVLTVFANTLQHAALLFLSPIYPPGTATAILLLFPAIILLSIKAIHDKLVPKTYIILLYIGSIPQLISIITTQRQFPKSLRYLLDFASKIADFFNLI